MNNDTIFAYVIGLIQRKGKLPKGCDVAKFNYIDSGYIDSIALIKFILDIENKFDIEISEADMLLPQFRTIGGLVNIVNDQLIHKST